MGGRERRPRLPVSPGEEEKHAKKKKKRPVNATFCLASIFEKTEENRRQAECGAFPHKKLANRK